MATKRSSKKMAFTADGNRAIQKINVVIPAYNEADYICENIRQIQKCLQDSADCFNIIIVDDGSTDGTKKKSKKLAQSSDDIQVLVNESNIGKGASIKRGCREVTDGHVLLIDADLEIDINRLSEFINVMHRDDADIVVGSKKHPGSDVTVTFSRMILSRVYQFFIQNLFGLDISDTQVGMKLFNEGILREIIYSVQVDRFAFDIELLVLANQKGFTIKEAPVSISSSETTKSSVTLKSIIEMMIDTLQVYYRIIVRGYTPTI